MKKIISVLVALLMLVTSMSAFAAMEVNPNSPSKSYFNDLSSYTGSISNGPLTQNASYPIDFEYKNGEYIFSRTEGSKASGLTYIGFGDKDHSFDNIVFGYDIKFTGITSETVGSVFTNAPGTRNTVFTDTAAENIAKGEWHVGDPANGEQNNIAYDKDGKIKSYKTAWCFFKSGSLGFSTKKSGDSVVLGNNGEPAIFMGNAKLEQGEFYTFKVYLDQVNKTFKTAIVSADGTVQETGISGSVQNAFYAICKIDSQIPSTVNQGAAVTLDNLFVAGAAFEMDIPEEIAVNPNGTIEFLATIPDDISNPSLYINDTLVENLTIDSLNRFCDYKITATLPEGTVFGDATIEIRGTKNGAPVSSTANTELSLHFVNRVVSFNTPTSTSGSAGLRRIEKPGSPVTVEGKDGDANGAWSMVGGEVDFTSMNPVMKDGIVEFSFDFKSAETINQIRLRMTANTSTGTGFDWHGNKDGGSTDPYEYFINGHPQNELPRVGEWNHLLVRADFYNNYYKVYLNDAIIEEDIFTVKEGVTDQVMDARLIMNSSVSGTPIYLDNIKFEEKFVLGNSSSQVTAKYADGSTVVYEDNALSAINLTGFDFKLPFNLDAASAVASNFTLLNSKGEVVDATYTYADGTVTAALAGAALKTDNYKFIVSKNAIVSGFALGANVEVPFEINADDKVLDLDANAAVTDKVNLKVYAAGANKVVFKVNDNTVRTFAGPEADSLYEFLYAPSVVGKNIFDAYIYTDDGVNVVSSSFYYLVDAQMLQQSNAVESALTPATAAKGELIAGAGHDGSKAYKLISKEGEVKPDGTLNKDASNSNTSSFTPSNGLYRKMYTEFEIMPGKNTNVATEIGFSVSGQTYNQNTAAYRTFNPRGSSPSLFNNAGQILGTTTSFVPETWYKCCQLIDFDKMTCEWWIYTGDNYETLVVSTKDDISNIGSSAASAYPNWKDDIVVTFKYKICVHANDINIVAPTEENPDGNAAWVMLDNFKRWHPVETPSVASVTANGAAVNNDVIAKGTDSITVTMDSDFHALPADKIAVTVDGANVGTVTPIDNKSFTVSGLAGVAEGKKINIKLLKGLSVPYRNNTAAVQADFSFDVLVGDSNGVYLYPISVETSDGTDLTAYAKYINGSSNNLDTFFIMTEYENDDQTLVKQTNFAPLNVKAGKVGAVSGYLTGIQKAQGCQVMLWNTDYAPILEAGSVK